jgi:hypothetical protein
MTCEQFEPGQWRLSFIEPESEFVLATLARLGRHYQEDISQMPPALRAYWQGIITAETGNAPRAEVRELAADLAEARTELRADRLALVENWMREYELAEERNPWSVELTTAERDEFIAMLNDRRMALALELAVTEEDMEADLAQIPSDARRAAILEIDVLGHFILVMLGPQIYRES